MHPQNMNFQQMAPVGWMQPQHQQMQPPMMAPQNMHMGPGPVMVMQPSMRPALSSSPRGNPGPRMGGGSGGSDGRWHCEDCGFNNGERNQQCGGTGELGCNRPRSVMPQWNAPFNPAAHHMPQPMARMEPMRATPQARHTRPEGDSDRWHCPNCAFSNTIRNERCGGNGKLGCNAPRPPPHQMENGRPMRQSQGGRWNCFSCGFKNSETNSKCGGNGALGCNAPRNPAMHEAPGHGQGLTPQQHQALASLGISSAPPPAGRHYVPSARSSMGNRGSSSGDRWHCDSCKFNNTARNEICGGSGPLGCNAPRPDGAGGKRKREDKNAKDSRKKQTGNVGQAVPSAAATN